MLTCSFLLVETTAGLSLAVNSCQENGSVAFNNSGLLTLEYACYNSSTDPQTVRLKVSMCMVYTVCTIIQKINLIPNFKHNTDKAQSINEMGTLAKMLHIFI